MKFKVLFLSVIVMIIGVSSFAYNAFDADACINVATAVATNVAIARSNLGDAQAIATSIAHAGDDVTAISHAIATVDQSLYGIAIAISTAVAVNINVCPFLKRTLRMLGISLETTLALTDSIAYASTNPEYDDLKAALQRSNDNINNGISQLGL